MRLVVALAALLLTACPKNGDSTRPEPGPGPAPVADAAAGSPTPVGQSCGTRGQQQCPEGQYCKQDMATECGAADQPGTCQARPDMCAQVMDEVCGCNGTTYSNECEAARDGVSVLEKGRCE